MEWTAERWNARFGPSWPVIVRLADGKRIRTETAGRAYRVGQFDMVAVAAIAQGGIPLTWCWPVKSANRAPMLDVPGATSEATEG